MKRYLKPLIFISPLVVLLALFLLMEPAQSVNASSSIQADFPASFRITSTYDQGLNLTVSAPSYRISQIEIEGQNFDRIEIPGAYERTTAGSPELPIVSTLIGVPAQAEIRLEIVSDAPEKIDGQYRVANAPFPARLTGEQETEDLWDYAQMVPAAASQTEASFAPLRIAEEAWIRDQRVIRLEYTPFEYNPANGQLIRHPAVDFRLQFEYPDGKIPENLGDSTPPDSEHPLEALLHESLLNYEQAKSWREFPASNSAQVTPPDVGPRYRIAIEEDGIYKLTFEELSAANPAISGVNSQLLHMTSQGEEIAIQVVDPNGSFGVGDYIIFYGQRFDGNHLADLYQDESLQYRMFTQQQTDGTYQLWKPEFNAIMLEKYTYENIYWLYVGTTNGQRMTTTNGDPSGNSNLPVPYYRATVRGEESMVWKTTTFTGEDTWFWQRMQQNNVFFAFTTTASSVATGGPNAIVRGEIVSAVNNSATGFDHHSKIYFNSTTVTIDDAWWSGISRYHFEHEVTNNPTTILNGTNTLRVLMAQTDQILAPDYFFDWFEIEYNRLFQAENDIITFSSADTGLQKYQVSGFSSTGGLIVLDISDPFQPKRVLNPALTASQATISLNQTEPISISMAASAQSVPAAQISYYNPPDWSDFSAGVDYIYITPADFMNATQQLADYRAATGLSTLVLDVQDVYNEFNFGIFHPIAIKNFLAYTFDHWQKPPTFVLLVGDGNWNFHEFNTAYYGVTPQYLPPYLAWVDPWQGEVDSTNLLATVVGADALADVEIARLPVNSSAEVEAYLAKITGYEAAHTPQAWEQNHLFVADLADSAGNFPALADDVINQYVNPSSTASELRIYESDYGCTQGAQCPAAKAAIIDALNNTGVLIANYIGHASVNRWSHEYIFTLGDVASISNSGRLPVLVSMTCLDGYWSGPSGYPGTSMIEEMVRKSDSGAIGAFSPTGLGVSTGHDILHKGFYDSLLNAGNWELGSAAQNAKLWLFTVGIHPDLLHTYTVFGDPALQIRNPFRGFAASPEESTQTTLYPGTTVTHTITVENTGPVADRYRIDVNSDWQVSLPYTTTGLISPGASVEIPVGIETPGQYEVSDTALATITSAGNQRYTFEAQLTTIVPKVYEFEVMPASSQVLAQPNTVATHTLTIINQGLLGNTYNLELGGSTWPASLSTNATTWLDPDESAEVYIWVETPGVQEVSDSAVVTITSSSGPVQSVQVDLLTAVPKDYDFSLTPLNAAQSVPPGSLAAYTLTIQNTGIVSDSYQIEISGNNWSTQASMLQTGFIELNESVQFVIQVQTPTQAGLSDTASITVTSMSVPSENRQASLVTSTASYRIYLPLIVK